MTAAAAVVRLRVAKPAPKVDIGVTTDVVRGMFRNFICYPRQPSVDIVGKVGGDWIELLAVDADSDGIADFTFCVPRDDIELIAFCGTGIDPTDVSDLLDAEGTGACDVRTYDLGYSGGSSAYLGASILARSSPSATTETDLYTVSANLAAKVSGIMVCNRAAVDATYRVSIAPAGVATANNQFMYYDTLVMANSTVIIDLSMGVGISSGDVIRIYASSADLTFTLLGENEK